MIILFYFLPKNKTMSSGLRRRVTSSPTKSLGYRPPLGLRYRPLASPQNISPPNDIEYLRNIFPNIDYRDISDLLSIMNLEDWHKLESLLTDQEELIPVFWKFIEYKSTKIDDSSKIDNFSDIRLEIKELREIIEDQRLDLEAKIKLAEDSAVDRASDDVVSQYRYS